MSYSLISASQKGKRKLCRGEDAGSLNPPEVTSAGGWKACNNGGKCCNSDHLPFAPLRWEVAISDQSTDPPGLEDRVLFVHSGCCKLCASCPRNTCTAACHMARDREWVAATVVRAETDQNSPSKPSPGSCKPSSLFNRFQSSKIVTSDKFCQCDCCVGGETDFLLPLIPPSSQNLPGTFTLGSPADSPVPYHMYICMTSSFHAPAPTWVWDHWRDREFCSSVATGQMLGFISPGDPGTHLFKFLNSSPFCNHVSFHIFT